MSDERRRPLERLVANMEIPEDVAYKLPHFHLIGDRRLSIENHMGILEYGSQKIRIQTEIGEIEIMGEKMYIITLDRILLELGGRILSIRVLEEER